MGTGVENGYNEIVQRAYKRYDCPKIINSNPICNDIYSKGSIISDILLGHNQHKLLFNGLLMSLPGSKEHLWHLDGQHLYSSIHLPLYAFNLFVPLVDISN